MPSIANRALLLDLTAFIAENNIRRGVLTVASNTLSSGEGINERSLVLNASASTTMTGLTGNKATVIKTNKPLQAHLVKSSAGSGISITFQINSLFVYTDFIESIELTNLDDVAAAQVRILQV